MTTQETGLLSIYRPVTASDTDPRIIELCDRLGELSDKYDSIKVYSPTASGELALRQDLARDSEIRRSLGEAALGIVADPKLHSHLRSTQRGSEGLRKATVMEAALRSNEATGIHVINLKLDESTAGAIKHERLMVCNAIMDFADRRGIRPEIKLGAPIHTPSVRLMFVPPGTLADAQMQTLYYAVKACLPIDLVLGRMVFPSGTPE